jgi:hypothetical protein
MSPISAVMHKINRAKVHLDAPSEFVKSWSESAAKSISTHDDLERGEYIVEIIPLELDLRGALIAGDFICCLRSSLDHLAWQPDLRNSKTNPCWERHVYAMLLPDVPDAEANHQGRN